MDKEFLIEIKTPSEYDYIDGRVKVLETYIFTSEEISRLVTLSIDDLVGEFLGSHYKQFIIREDASGVIQGIKGYYDSILNEMERYVSRGFVNSFFRSKKIFMRIKSWALGFDTPSPSPLYERIRSFLQGGKEDFPEILRTTYIDLKNLKYNPILFNICLDIGHLSFLLDSAYRTRNQFIEGYFKLSMELNFEAILIRLLNLFEREEVNERLFLDVLSKMKVSALKFNLSSDILSFKDVDSFREFLRSEETSYGVSEGLRHSPDVYIKMKLASYLEKGSSFNSGIEPVFIYLEKLSAEVDLLDELLEGKVYHLSDEQILKEIGLAYD